MPGVTWIPVGSRGYQRPLGNRDPGIADSGKESQGCQRPNDFPPITQEARGIPGLHRIYLLCIKLVGLEGMSDSGG